MNANISLRIGPVAKYILVNFVRNSVEIVSVLRGGLRSVRSESPTRDGVVVVVVINGRVSDRKNDTKNVLATKVASGVKKSVDASKKMASTLEEKRFLDRKNKNNGSIQL